MTQENRQCQNCKNQFTIEPEDFEFYKKINVPPPTWCSECRLQRRLASRNERALYKDVCDLCGKSMISLFSEDKPFKVYCKECWYSDNWDPLEYGLDYDWNKPFFAQFRKLLERVPRVAVMQVRGSTETTYANYTLDAKNVYLGYSIVRSEDVAYSRFIDDSKNTFDSLNAKNLDTAYENIDSHHNYNSQFLLRSRNCVNSAFLFDCVNCQDCFMSSNLRNKQFMIRNKQYSKDQYEAELKNIDTGSFKASTEYRIEFLKLLNSALHKFANVNKVSHVVGDNVENSKNIYLGFDLYDSENIKYGSRMFSAKETYDTLGQAHGELLYESLNCGFGAYNTHFSFTCDGMRDSDYVDWCLNSNNIFASSGLRKKEYCIFNKQYTKEDYYSLKTKIIEQMSRMPYVDKKGRTYKYGEFFPIELLPFAYNETIAQEQFILTKEEALEEGYSWKDFESKNYKPSLLNHDIPDHINDVKDDILDQAIECAHKNMCHDQCTSVFKLIPDELVFYRKVKLSVPRLCPNCRYYERLKLRNPQKIWDRQCLCDYTVWKNSTKHNHHPEGRCSNTFHTTYSADRKEIIYCEACYNAEVV